MSYKQQLREIIREYENEVSGEPTSLEEIAQWAIDNKKWFPRPRDVVKICRDELADAAREDVIIDAEGREVRVRHCVRASENGKQYTLWGNMSLSPENFLSKSFAQRRQQIGRDCHKLKQDADHFNDHRKPAQPYHPVLNFEDDVAELEAARVSSRRASRKPQ